MVYHGYENGFRTLGRQALLEPVAHPWQMEVSGFHHNVFDGFLSLRLALFCAGDGEVRLRDFVYRGLSG